MRRTIELLIADDEAEVVESLASQFLAFAEQMRLKVNVTKCYSASEAAALSKTTLMDGIILDYYFDGGASGLDAIEEIHDPFGHAMFVIVSGHDENALTLVINRLSLRYGNRFRFLRKPVDGLEVRVTLLAIKNFIEQRPLPHPFAYALQKVRTANTGMTKFWATMNLIEIFLKYLSAIMVAELARAGMMSEISIPIDLGRELTLGAWILLQQELSTHYCKSITDPFIPQLRTLLCNGDEENSTASFLWRFRDYRNKLSGAHQYVADDEWYNDLLKKEEAAISAFVQDLNIVSSYPLLAPESIDPPANDQIGLQYNVRVLMGQSEQFETQKVRVVETLNTSEVYIYSIHGCSSVFPFMVYHLCAPCRSKKIYLLEAIQPEQFVYTAFCNHSIEIAGGLKALKKRFPDAQWTKSRSAGS